MGGGGEGPVFASRMAFWGADGCIDIKEYTCGIDLPGKQSLDDEPLVYKLQASGYIPRPVNPSAGRHNRSSSSTLISPNRTSTLPQESTVNTKSQRHVKFAKRQMPPWQDCQRRHRIAGSRER